MRYAIKVKHYLCIDLGTHIRRPLFREEQFCGGMRFPDAIEMLGCLDAMHFDCERTTAQGAESKVFESPFRSVVVSVVPDA